MNRLAFARLERGRAPAFRSRPPLPSARRAAEIGAGAAVLAAGAFALYYWRERSREEAAHSVAEKNGAFAVRRYEPLHVAEVRCTGTLADALDDGYRQLSAYLSGKPGSRANGAGDDPIAMAVPVSAAPGQQAGSWLIRVALPRSRSANGFPEPAGEVALRRLPGRTVAVLRFAGRGTDRELVARKHRELLDAVEARGLRPAGEPELAVYNAPIVPGALRRNEWWVDVAR